MDRFIRPQAMTKTRSQQLSEKADEQRRRCREWLLPFNHLVPSLSTLVRGRDATDWVPSSESRIWNKPGVTAGREPAERL